MGIGHGLTGFGKGIDQPTKVPAIGGCLPAVILGCRMHFFDGCPQWQTFDFFHGEIQTAIFQVPLFRELGRCWDAGVEPPPAPLQ